MKKPVAVLIGAPGSGKSSTGRALAAMLDVTLRDTDHDVEARAGIPIGDIFVEHGEEHFRALEREAVAAALAEHDGVLALGGGAVLDAETRRALTGHTVVYLEVGLTDAVKRVGLAQARPLLAMNPRARLKKLLDERLPVYEGLAVITVHTDGLTPREVAERVAAELSGARR
ncbi:MAG: shikimate kinase [Streptosporangiales bacterium]|nr:shikimate kinase [Streptosporangiales bacterium]